jgi:three-Cys-motif partner protein
VTPDGGRTWGFWTQLKLAMLRDYLTRFAVASQTQPERIYLDAFAGEGAGRDRLTGEEFHGSARIALDVGSGNGFTRFRYFELGPKAAELATALRADYPDRDIKVYAGDCNVTIPQALAELKQLNWAPTFAFVDPDGMEVAWETLAALADHKRGYRAASSLKPEYKVEIWMLFPSAGIMRTLALGAETLPDRDVARATRLLGTERWQSIYALRRSDEISPKQAREEYVNLMRWRLEQELGYRYTHPFELCNTTGAPMYHMILATDNDVGTKIMSAIYTNAAQTVPEMRQQARDRRQGQQAFSFNVVVGAEQATYTYEPPWEPRG